MPRRRLSTTTRSDRERLQRNRFQEWIRNRMPTRQTKRADSSPSDQQLKSILRAPREKSAVNKAIRAIWNAVRSTSGASDIVMTPDPPPPKIRYQRVGQFPFLSLPAEVRVFIYEHYFKGKYMGPEHGSSRLPGLLRICKRVYLEAIPTYYEQAIFTFPLESFRRWLDRLPACNRMFLRNVRIDAVYWWEMSDDLVDRTAELARAMARNKGLDEVTVEVGAKLDPLAMRLNIRLREPYGWRPLIPDSYDWCRLSW